VPTALRSPTTAELNRGLRVASNLTNSISMAAESY
jgi:hypothetical protein